MTATPTETIAPHGGELVDLLLPATEADRAREEAGHLPKVAIGNRELSDLEMMAVGALSPLTGFTGEKDYWSVIDEMHLSNGLPWTIPVTLSLDESEAKRIGGASSVALTADDVAGGLEALLAGLQAARENMREPAAAIPAKDLIDVRIGVLLL